jgi:hypothetical protein
MDTDAANVVVASEENSHEAAVGTGEETIGSAGEANFPELKGVYGVR